MLKVIVTGAFSTGKTSLLETLAKELVKGGVSVKCLPDVARTCRFPLNEGQTDTTTLWLLMTQISREIEASLGYESVLLCDRGIPDILAHNQDVRQKRDSGWLETLGTFPDNWISTYDLILFSRIDESVSIAADGLRSEDPAYRKQLDRYAEDILAGHANTVTLAHDFSERVPQALDAITGALNSSRTSTTL